MQISYKITSFKIWLLILVLMLGIVTVLMVLFSNRTTEVLSNINSEPLVNFQDNTGVTQIQHSDDGYSIQDTLSIETTNQGKWLFLGILGLVLAFVCGFVLKFINENKSQK